MPHQVAVTVRAAIVDGHREALEEQLRALRAEGPSGSRLPLRALPGTHFAACSCSMAAALPEGESLPDSLLYMADVEGRVDRHLHELVRRATAGLDAVFGHCEGWPGGAPERERLAWLRAHGLRPAAYCRAPASCSPACRYLAGGRRGDRAGGRRRPARRPVTARRPGAGPGAVPARHHGADRAGAAGARHRAPDDPGDAAGPLARVRRLLRIVLRIRPTVVTRVDRLELTGAGATATVGAIVLRDVVVPYEVLNLSLSQLGVDAADVPVLTVS